MSSSIEEHPSTRDGSSDVGTAGEITVMVGEHTGGAPVGSATPQRVGRYLVVEQVGAGGMGRVLRAYDPKLRREVALKLLSPSTQESQGAARIVREAQAMARLSHPNLVPVYDVELEGDDVFIAMEYVEGDTLRTWLDRAPRSWNEVVQAFVGAGRGLAAAHAAGVVHRDFKPSNAMVVVEAHGERTAIRVRVMDFGLARGISAHHGGDGPSLADVELSEVTQVGTVVGTPPYMAPEQHRGGAVAPASDQYAFCVALYEALFGVRPFAGADLRGLVRAKLRGVPDAPPAKGPKVPPWLRAIVVRGLAAAPDDRWPSMVALLAALERGQARARTRRWIAAVGAVAVVGGAVVVVHQLDVRHRTSACEQAGASIDAVWNEQARTRLQQALLATGVSFAGTTATNVTPWLDQQAAAWRRAQTDACMASEVDGVWDRQILDRAQWCLDERRMQLEALVSALSTQSTDAVKRAVAAAASLSRVDPCVDAAMLARLPAPPTERREEVRVVRADLSRVDALERTGRYAEGLALVSATRERAQTLGWPPLTAAIMLREANLHERHSDYDAAERVGSDAYFLAAEVGEWDVAARAAIKLAVAVGTLQARREPGLVWGRHAAVAMTYAGDVDGLREAHRLNAIGSVHHRAGDHAQARELHERALAIQEAALGPDHPELALTLNNLANAVQSLGEYEAARVLHIRARDISERALGPDHPDVAVGLSNIAVADYAAGNYTAALELNERALDIRQRALGPAHTEVGASLANLGNVHQAMGRYADARGLYERALAVWEAALGPDHPDVAASVGNLAISYYSAGDYAKARALSERAVAIYEKTVGPDHPYVALCLVNLALVETATGDHVAARGLLARALAIREKALGAEHPDVATVLATLGNTSLELGDLASARSLLERSLAIREKAFGADHFSVAQSLSLLAETLAAAGNHQAAIGHFERAMAIYDRDPSMIEGELGARFDFARVLRAVGGDAARARALAEQARDGWRVQGEGGGVRLAEVEAWLAAGEPP